MVNQESLFNSLQEIGIRFFSGVPDSLLNDFCLYLCQHYTNEQHVMAANEGNAVAIAAGHYLATGDIPVVYMQNSGIGNATNPLLSLAHSTVYGIPMILVIGWRGDPDIKDHAQHKKQGELTPILMRDMDIPYEILDDENTVIDKFCWAYNKAKELSAPVALISKKGILTQKEKHQEYPESTHMNREEAISSVIDVLGSDAIYLATTGRATRELHEQLKLKGVDCGHEFLNVGSMGHVSSVALGMAIARPDKIIVVFDGDAAAVMHMGSLATIGRYQPKNLIHIVLNNGVNESVGGQPSAGQMIDLTAIAKSCSYMTSSIVVKKSKDLKTMVEKLAKADKPAFIDVHIRQGIRQDMPKLDINHRKVIQNLRSNFSGKE